MSTYAISDLHGQYGIFDKLLEKAGFSDADELYMLGDAIDRGPDGIRILEHVMNAPNMHFLLGNHEFMMLNSVDPGGSAPVFGDTLPGRDANLWLNYNGGDKTYSRYKRFKKNNRIKLLEWLYSCPLSTKVEVDGKTFILTHSFFDMDKIDVPYKDLEYREVWNIVWNSPFRADLFVDNERYRAYEPWTFVVGHVPVGHARGGLLPIELSSYRVDNIIDIDGGCSRHSKDDAAYKGGILLRLDDLSEFTVSFAEIKK
ncbi:MAG: serine/threonine protein phosphatase [Butyrivibrio sp.]|nr:serine/threonine protein phosphatase [Butyrivibrio sp.]